MEGIWQFLRKRQGWGDMTRTGLLIGNWILPGIGPGGVYSVNINSGSTNWNMLTGDTFTVTLQAWNAANAGATPPIVEGAFTADNFFAYTGTAIPEPATATLLLGLGVFALVLQRRRRHRP